MTFYEQLNKYIKQIECSSKELVSASGLSTSVISRYRRGDRTPGIRSKQLEQLVDGLYKLSNVKGLNLTREEIYITLSATLNDIVLVPMILLYFLKFVPEIRLRQSPKFLLRPFVILL